MIAKLCFQAVRALRDTCSKEDTRPALQYVHIRSDGIAEATNGHLAIRIPLEFDEGDPPIPESWIAAERLKAVKAGDTLVIDFERQQVGISPRNGGFSAILDKALETDREPYPNLDSVWPTFNGDAKRIAFNGQYLKRLADATGQPTHRLTFTIEHPDRPALVEIGGHEYEGGNWKAILMPLRIQD